MKRSSSPSSPRSAPAPDLALGPSRRWRKLVFAAHAAALLSLLLIPWPMPARLLMALALLTSLGVSLRPLAWTRLVAAGEGRWWLFDRAGAAREACLLDGGLRHPWLVTLPLRLADGRRLLLPVWADAVTGDDHTALRRWLVSEASRDVH